MYTDESVNQLIKAVEEQFQAHLAKADAEASDLAKSEGASEVVEAELAKAEDEKPEAKDKEEKKEAPKSEEKPEAAAAEAPKADAAPAKEEGEAAAPNAEAPAADAEAAPAAPADAEGHGYDAEDLAALEQMYASMSRPELKAHHDAIKACLDAQGMEKCGSMAMAEAPAAPAPMAKSEETVPAEVELLKSESSAKDVKIQELQKSLDVATEFLNKLFTKKTAPKEKAITSLETIAKNEGVNEDKELSKGEINAILTKKASDPSLKKSDRELINAFCLTGTSINSISHLLK